MLGPVLHLGRLGDAALGAATTHGAPVTPSAMDRPKFSATAEARLRTIVEANYDFVWRFLRGLGVSGAGVDDATQQVFWIAAQKLEDIVVGSERSFLFSTARGVAANARRAYSRNREQGDEERIATQVDDRPDPEQAAADNEARRMLEGLLEQMNEELRTVFILFELEGFSTPAIAEMLGAPTGTIASRLRRARDEFARGAERLRHMAGGEGP
jgi:RNA polymerase sigma-70 factor (ECF subfamily)